MFRISIARLVVPAVLSAAALAPASAQETQLFTWMGRVDRNVRLTVQPGNVSATTESSIQSRTRARINARLPQQDGQIRVSMDRGRGNVNVVQQPNASNGYTALIDISDPQGGAEMYSVTAYWTPTGRMYGDRRYDRGQNGDPRYDRGQNGDPRYDRNRGGDPRYDRRESSGDYVGNAPALHWSGDVNTGVELVWRNGNIIQRMPNNGAVRNVSSSLSGATTGNPNGSVQVNLRSGRGRVDVIQQPNANNNYTTIIRIVDPQGGFGHYQLDAYWR